MRNDFKKRVAQKRAAVPQVDPESMDAPIPALIQNIAPPTPVAIEPTPKEPETQAPTQQSTPITIVDTSETAVNRGFFMYPSRHRQVTRDLVYIEGRKPWKIIDDALEEYVVRHYGKQYKRK